MPQLQEDREDFILQQDGSPTHFHFDVRAHLNSNLPGRWIGRASHNDSPLLPWPPRSPDLTPAIYSYAVTSRIVCTCRLCHVIYHSCDTGTWRQSPLSTARRCNVCGRNFITGLTSAVSPRVDISRTCKVGQKLGVTLPLLTCSLSAWLGYCTVEVGTPRGAYELPHWIVCSYKKVIWNENKYGR
jgi:hypothetical protein